LFFQTGENFAFVAVHQREGMLGVPFPRHGLR
jgi:hypothetical protein